MSSRWIVLGRESDGNYFEWISDGANGKYEVINGVKRLKWNNYSLSRVTMYGSKSWMGYSVPLSASAANRWGSNDDVILQSKLVSAIRGHQFNMAVFAAEGKMTVDMVLATARTLATAFKMVKRGDLLAAHKTLLKGVRVAGFSRDPERDKLFRAWYSNASVPAKSRVRAPETARELSGRWLELQYGWLPLLSDCYEAGQALAALTERPRILRFTVGRNIKYSREGSASPSNWSGMLRVLERKSIIAEISEVLSTPRSLGLLDPLSVAWEITPFSFVADWFIPIGSYLDNLSVIPMLSGRFCTTYSRSESGRVTWTSPLYGAWYRGGTCVRQSLAVTRVISTNLTTAHPGFKPWPKALSAGHIYNAIALLTQSMK